MAQRLVAGVDCSTQGTKVLVVDADTGQVAGEGRSAHEVTGRDGARETDPAVWWDALRAAIAGTGLGEQVAAISVAAQQHGLVVVGGDGRPLRPAVLWNDTRSAGDAARLVDVLGGPDRWAAEVGSVPVASFTVSSWAWLRRTEPERAQAARAVRLPHDWLTERLCGRGVTDRGDASGTGWWSTATGRYVDEVLGHDEVALDPEFLPDVLGPTDRAGEVMAEAAEVLGLSAGALVGPGTGDNMGAALGLGLAPGTPVLSLGTSGTVYAVSERRPADATGLVSGFADATGRFLPLACTLNCTLAVDRVAEWLGLHRDAAASSTTAVMLPYLDGERTPNLPHATGTLSGLRRETTREEILRAAYEGAVFSLLDALDRVGEQAGGLAGDVPLVLIGGGAQGRVWREVVARLSGRPLEVPAAAEFVALGAAAQAAGVLLGEPPEAVARRWGTRTGDLVDPQPRDEAALERLRGLARGTAELNRAPLS